MAGVQRNFIDELLNILCQRTQDTFSDYNINLNTDIKIIFTIISGHRDKKGRLMKPPLYIYRDYQLRNRTVPFILFRAAVSTLEFSVYFSVSSESYFGILFVKIDLLIISYYILRFHFCFPIQGKRDRFLRPLLIKNSYTFSGCGYPGRSFNPAISLYLKSFNIDDTVLT